MPFSPVFTVSFGFIFNQVGDPGGTIGVIFTPDVTATWVLRDIGVACRSDSTLVQAFVKIHLVGDPPTLGNCPLAVATLDPTTQPFAAGLSHWSGRQAIPVGFEVSLVVIGPGDSAGDVVLTGYKLSLP